MHRYHYELVNVFAEEHWGGNPLAVFTQADGLTEQNMQRIARQMNLSECVFIQTPTQPSAVKKLRIFTPEYEMSFAGHPTIGAAFVLRNMLNIPAHCWLQTQAGLVELTYHEEALITFSLPFGTVENAPLTRAEAADILGLKENDIASAPSWVNTGTDQLLVELSHINAIKTCRIQTALFLRKALSKSGISQLYIWHEQNQLASVRLFFALNGTIVEDPGTGSAAANLGSWCVAHGRTPLSWKIQQGDEIGRPNRLTLVVNDKVHVGGKVIKIGQGEILVP